MIVFNLQDVCFESECLTQGWINTLAILAVITSTIAGVGAVRMIHSNLSYLDNIAPLCIIFSKIRVGINTPLCSCG